MLGEKIIIVLVADQPVHTGRESRWALNAPKSALIIDDTTSLVITHYMHDNKRLTPVNLTNAAGI